MKELILIVVAMLICTDLFSQERRWEMVMDLRGEWKFEIGDNLKWSKTDLDDSNWETIFVPASWEDEGFPGYDGFAWYRKQFRFEKKSKEEVYYLLLGNIDDVDEVYLNGHFIGAMGGFHPQFVTQYSANREYRIPSEYINFHSENVLAVRVYDAMGPGGIVNGRIGIYINISQNTPDVDLAGLWKFKIGDIPGCEEAEFDDSDWKQILVPMTWEVQGYPDYDGIAWYRKSFRLPKDLEEQRLILLLGKIDDFDETYLNGVEIGHTGTIPDYVANRNLADKWQKIREYYIPSEFLKTDRENQIAVRVYDGYLNGGIYEGPIGIVTRERFLKWKKQIGEYKKATDFKEFLEMLFGN